MPLTASQQKLLRQSPLFKGCNAANYTTMIQSLEPYTLTKGNTFVPESSLGRPLCFLMSGAVEYSTASGVVFTTHKAPYLFFSGIHSNDTPDFMPRICSISPISVFAFISEDAVKSAIRTDSAFATNLLNLLGTWCYDLHFMACRFSASSPSARLAMFLEQNNIDGIVDLSFGLSKLAHTLDISRATLYRSLAELEEQHLICKNKKTISISSNERLGNYITESIKNH